jgi:hypothetical protein
MDPSKSAAPVTEAPGPRQPSHAPSGARRPGTRRGGRNRRCRCAVRRVGRQRAVDRVEHCARSRAGGYAGRRHDRPAQAGARDAAGPCRRSGRGGGNDSDRLSLLPSARQDVCGPAAGAAPPAEAQPASRRRGRACEVARARRAHPQRYTGASAGARAVPASAPAGSAAARAAQRRDIDLIVPAASNATVGPQTITLATSSGMIRAGRDAT